QHLVAPPFLLDGLTRIEQVLLLHVQLLVGDVQLLDGQLELGQQVGHRHVVPRLQVVQPRPRLVDTRFELGSLIAHRAASSTAMWMTTPRAPRAWSSSGPAVTSTTMARPRRSWAACVVCDRAVRPDRTSSSGTVSSRTGSPM